MQHNSEDLNQNQNPQTTGDDLSGELLENLDYQDQMKEKEKQSDIHKLWEVFSYLFGTENLGDYSCYTKSDKQCSDGSDLYSIIKYKGKDLIIKVGAGEFNTDIFNIGGIPELKGLHNTPIPLFVVNQIDSYLADDNIKTFREDNPKDYLSEHAVIVVPRGGKAYFRGYGDRKNPINFGDINIKDYQNTLNEGRLAILHKEFPNGQFQECLNTIEDFQQMDFDKFYNTVYKNSQYMKEEDKKGNNMLRVLGCFRHMGVYRAGSGVGDTKAFKSLYDLIKSFNIQEQKF